MKLEITDETIEMLKENQLTIEEYLILYSKYYGLQ